MQLTKTNFIQYLQCPESLWLLKNKPENYPNGEFSLFLEKLVTEGYEVEAYAQDLFPEGLKLESFVSPEKTKAKLSENHSHFFQPAFETAKGALAVIDILEKNQDGSYNIYEVKSSTSIHTDKKHNHLKDACFQKYVMTECGYNISKVFIIHLNKEYVKNGEINPNELLEIKDVTDKLDEIYSETVNEINAALNFLTKQIDTSSNCSCIENTRNNHCDAFKYFNPEVRQHSIYEINGIRAKKIIELRDLGVLNIKDIPSDFVLSEKQQLQVVSNIQKKPLIQKDVINETLNSLKFPLHFIDYETFPTAIPKVDGMRPHQHLTFQVSIHTLAEDGMISHFEYLADKMELPKKLIEGMEQFTGSTGTFVSWYAPFEKKRNEEMASLFPEHKSYLEYINSHMFDLEKLFYTAYVDYRFLGRTSIKNVLPVLEPELSYKNLEIQNGTMALDTWGRLMLEPESFEDTETVKKDLLAYCELDTEAMVRIYQKLKNLN
ncbi:DUF2779 domain-containing protein [Seonamhaeicola aphaedonensis]|uniref:Uncharacterized protein DUF2779 n=1 Tax=Seonamhaeicola aphaedonensis TaxID=1461338 RepID=A0A3D9HHE6_9FLAO|nr:DUF2779 domain-containing protein [Seonamhaeicola aphaedonensis]RED48805.1 uncharacterized protein DUF2779 [Seonamhaeicola aphaedonensis]